MGKAIVPGLILAVVATSDDSATVPSAFRIPSMV